MTPKQVREFVLAGNALFTITSLRTGKHFTYKAKRSVRYDQKLGLDVPVSPAAWKISVLNGRDNSKDYRYIGLIHESDKRFRHRFDGVTTAAKGFEWVWNHLERCSERFEFRHAGRCGRCGRRLTVPSSIDSGIGPECADKMAFEAMGGADGLLDQLFGG